MKNIVKNLLDERTKSIIRSSDLYQVLYNRMHSSKLAVRGKRLDICANEVAIYLLQSGKEKYVLRDKICLEIGSGWLLTHSLVFYLLGAKQVYATDIYPLLQPENIFKAVSQSVDWSILDSLSTFEDRHILDLRLKKLLSLKNLSVEALKDLGIEYIAPIDLSQKMPTQERIDFIFSKSVLEHVPVDDVVPLLKNLASSLSEDGFMFHLIDLVDHRNREERPFDFFIYQQEAYSRELQSRWGNRIRRSQWKQIFSNLKHLNYKFVFEWSRQDGDFPEKIDSSIQYTDEEDLRISHIGVVGELISLPKVKS
ncbi:hypothetical protein CDG77_06265 [Nostoc sp. 'Peltigera membranacea cyanobiont' 213]|uniref:methyltransferase domain-containing protein n=1 Tax=unclassified Nostoc TaxID=2593658 RepID=UPI000B9F99AD|nr:MULTISPECIES: methyltransferase domain-containing protein [unclassified Nostoc]AVH65440.1 hypothetical protein NPM_3880 [Nostoc sp. 'Peltigera membranacea cyanobiont' N6]OYD98388.1 hypothetical protein CDG77_06265 [Nostoc sp. 'Peltigera membranacea cyanobiont' 213]